MYCNLNNRSLKKDKKMNILRLLGVTFILILWFIAMKIILLLQEVLNVTKRKTTKTKPTGIDTKER